MPVRTVIVDDEPAVGEFLEQLLVEQHPEVAIIGVYADPAEAVEAITAEPPDLLFVDVRMPRLSGFDLLDALGDRVPPAVVFVTAFDQHAIAAFDASATDYLLKPVDEERLARAVARATTRVAQARSAAEGARASSVADPVDALRHVLSQLDRYTRHFAVRVGHRIALVRVEDISWFGADGKYVRLYVDNVVHLVRHTMHGLEARLDPRRFLRVNRSSIVNVDHVKHIERWSHGDYVLVMRTGHSVVTTRGYRAAVQRLLHGA
jgi:two-component system LytT family response regulator